MISLEDFMETLRAFAEHYTEEHLYQLHRDVHDFTLIPIATYKTKRQPPHDDPVPMPRDAKDDLR